MLRGNHPAKIDEKGRLKVPTPFRRLIEEKHGTEFYITSLAGDNVRIYPLPEWEVNECEVVPCRPAVTSGEAPRAASPAG